MYNSKQSFTMLFLKIVTPILLLVALSSYFFLKKIEDDKKNLMYEQVQSMSSLIHSIYDFDAKYSFEFDPTKATLSQIQETFDVLQNNKFIHLRYFLGKVNGDYIEYLASSIDKKPTPIHMDDKEKAQSMRDALEGFSAVRVTQNFDGKRVFSAFTDIKGTSWALVIEQSYEDHITPFKEIALSVAFLSFIVLLILYFLLAYFENKNNELIKHSEDRFRHMVESTSDLVWEIDIEAKFTYLSSQVTSILGYSYTECLGKKPFDFMKEDEGRRVEAIFAEILSQNKCIVDIESINIKKDKSEVAILTNGTPFYNSLGELLGYRGVSKNITVSKKYKEQMEQLAYYDTLTGLANRKNIMTRIEEEISYTLRQQTNSALIYLDLDGFKNINDTLGHNYGDEVLKIVACRLQESVREFDTVGRVGGDEFVILVRGEEKESSVYKEELVVLIERIKDSLNRVILFGGEEYHVGVSMGIAIIPHDTQSAYELVKKADSAMYKAKESGKNCGIFYDITIQEEVEQSSHLKLELLDGLKNNEFSMFYQAQYTADDHELVGYEALLRWKHPVKGLLEASEFIETIDKFGLNIEFDKYVFEYIYKDIDILLLNYESLQISVNISSKSFESDSFIVFLEERVIKSELETNKITLEIKEETLSELVNNAYLNRIRDLGFKISIDDFGTGYSSLFFLSAVEYHEIKLDSSFIQGISQSKKKRETCKLLLRMCKELGVKVVAEGVETHEQLAFLEEEGVDVIQGYLFAFPQSIEKIFKKV